MRLLSAFSLRCQLVNGHPSMLRSVRFTPQSRHRSSKKKRKNFHFFWPHIDIDRFTLASLDEPIEGPALFTTIFDVLMKRTPITGKVNKKQRQQHSPAETTPAACE